MNYQFFNLDASRIPGRVQYLMDVPPVLLQLSTRQLQIHDRYTAALMSLADVLAAKNQEPLDAAITDLANQANANREAFSSQVDRYGALISPLADRQWGNGQWSNFLKYGQQYGTLSLTAEDVSVITRALDGCEQSLTLAFAAGDAIVSASAQSASFAKADEQNKALALQSIVKSVNENVSATTDVANSVLSLADGVSRLNDLGPNDPIVTSYVVQSRDQVSNGLAFANSAFADIQNAAGYLGAANFVPPSTSTAGKTDVLWYAAAAAAALMVSQ